MSAMTVLESMADLGPVKTNPAAKTNRRRAKKHTRRRARSHRRNSAPVAVAPAPAPRTNRRRKARGYRRNPSGFLAKGKALVSGVGARQLAGAAVAGVLGAYASRWLTRLILKQNDVGALGYAANLGSGLAVASVARGFGFGKAAPSIALGAAIAAGARFVESVVVPNTRTALGLGDYIQSEPAVPVGLQDYIEQPAGFSGLGMLESDLPEYDEFGQQIQYYNTGYGYGY